MFQLTITNSYLPSELCTQCVIPIFKSGDCAVISNHHPISLSRIISKVLEKVILMYQSSFLSNSFTPHQFGFLPSRSTLQQLLFIHQWTIGSKTNRHGVRCQLSIDYKKVFDSVIHTKLRATQNKIFWHRWKITKWFEAYLSICPS